MVLQTIPLSLIYSPNTLPEYGYVRAKSFVRMISKEYGIDIDLDEANEIIKTTNDKIKTLIK